MPLTYAGEVDAEQETSEKHARARKIKPQYTRGDLRRVATGRQQPEAEFIQMLLLEEGVPSTLRRSAGFDVPDMLAAGPRDVLVPESGLEVAREVLLQSDIEVTQQPQVARALGGGPAAGMLLGPALLAARRGRDPRSCSARRRLEVAPHVPGRALGAGPTAPVAVLEVAPQSRCRRHVGALVVQLVLRPERHVGPLIAAKLVADQPRLAQLARGLGRRR